MKVTVLVMTYNHARYIRQAVESVLMQQVDFDYEILISEDCSTDGTRAIVTDFGEKHPTKVRLLLSANNLHSNEVVARGICAARGEYIALLDGDDYWTSADKLQRQVEFLDHHPECAICFHNALVVHEDGTRPAWAWTSSHQKAFTTLDDLWYGNYIATSSTLYRGGLFGDIPAWYRDLFPITDWPLHILHAEHGAIGYINEVMGVYRFHAGGLYSPLDEMEKLRRTLRFYHTMDRNLDYRYTQQIHRAIARYFFEWAVEYEARGDFAKARACLRMCISGRARDPRVRPRALVGMALRVTMPRLAFRSAFRARA